jgi:hypothetical protein
MVAGPRPVNKNYGNTRLPRRGIAYPAHTRRKSPLTIGGPYREFAAVLRELMDRDGRSISGIAYDALVDPSSLAKMRRGTRIAYRETIDLLAGALDLGPYDHARLLCAAGLLPHVGDPQFSEMVCRLVERWLYKPGTPPLTREP